MSERNSEWKDYEDGDQNALPNGQRKVLAMYGRLYKNDFIRWRSADNDLLVSHMTLSGSTKVETFGPRGGCLWENVYD